MPAGNSPFRYPGGKAALSDFLAEVLAANGLRDSVYIEPYAGGAGAALSLLFAEHVQRIVLNDADPCVHAFWNAILHRKDDFIRRLQEIPITVEEWKRQRDTYRHQAGYSRIRVALATFYLNRCNRSGIMVNGGPIGGIRQTGKWKLDARFNKDELIRRIDRIHMYRERIEVYNMDAIDFLRAVVARIAEEDEVLVYLDPPYYHKASRLYLNHYEHKDHVRLADFIMRQAGYHWIMTYDDVSEIRRLYHDCPCVPFHLSYSAHGPKEGHELLICTPELVLPHGLPIS